MSTICKRVVASDKNPPPGPHPQILRNDGLMRPLVVTTVDRLDLVLGLMGAQVGRFRRLSWCYRRHWYWCRLICLFPCAFPMSNVGFLHHRRAALGRVSLRAVCVAGLGASVA
jgi:hypothetical protein